MSLCIGQACDNEVEKEGYSYCMDCYIGRLVERREAVVRKGSKIWECVRCGVSIPKGTKSIRIPRNRYASELVLCEECWTGYLFGHGSELGKIEKQQRLL